MADTDFTTALKSRDSIRAEIFKTRKPRSVKHTFFGVEIELRQPRMGDVIDRVTDESMSKAGLISSLINYAYLPDTEEKLFTDEDLDGLRALPFGEEFSALADALTELMTANFKKPNVSSENTQ